MNNQEGNQIGACNALSVSLKGVAVADAENHVKLYSFPDGAYKGLATRFVLPARAVAFSASGATLASGGDDEGIKLINTDDRKVFRQLRSQAYTRGIAYDPKGEYVASVSADGTLCVWDIATGKAELQKKMACPKVDVAAPAVSRPAWHPDGGALLAAPGTDNDIVIYERLSWSVVYELSGAHSLEVHLVTFSKNGLYLASADADNTVVVWDVNGRKPLATKVLNGVATGASWHPGANALALITDDGELHIWSDVIPADLPGPNDDIDLLNGVVPGKGGAGQEDPSLMGGGAGGTDDYDRADSFLDDDGEEVIAAHAKAGGKRRRGGGDDYPSAAVYDPPAPQEPIQPGSTQMGDGGRRYLAYTPLGCIVQRAEEDHNTVEVSFHDTARMRRRIPLFKDFYNLSMAALGEKGALYASRSNRDSPSTVLYQPYESWAPNSDWSLGLPVGEEAECVAAGAVFAAVATSCRLLRIFSQAGLQRSVICLGGAPVALAGAGHLLAAVWHAAAPAPSGEQQLAYAIHDVAAQQELASGPLPLTPGSNLSWLGFSEEGLLASYDSEGELRMRSPDFGGAWVPLFSSAAERKGSERFWVFGVSAQQLQCIVVSGGEEPAVPPPPQRPLVSSVPLRAAVVGQDAVLAPLEAEIIRQGVLVSHMEPPAGGKQDEAARLELEAQQLEADKLGLKLFAKLIQSDRHARALEVASLLHGTHSLEGALKLANQLRAPTLAERLAAFVEQRLEIEAEEAAAAAAAQEQEEQQHYYMEEEQEQPRQGEAVTPVPAPAFPLSEARHQPSPSAGVKSSKASPPRPQLAGVAQAAAAVGPFAAARKAGGGQNAGPNHSTAGGGAAAAKRKAPSGNPFARKSKAVKG
ncbi:hypothetical protein N2152v2_010728 [Parachlorella kessleri]